MTEKVFEFDADFQEKIVALMLRDPKFCLQTEGLVEPHYFTEESNAAVFMLAKNYWDKYRETPSPALWVQILKDSLQAKVITKEQAPGVVAKLKTIGAADVSNRDFVIDKVDEFAKNQAYELAVLKSVELIEKRDFDAVKKVMDAAQMVGATKEDFDYDFFDNTTQRRDRRHAMVAGTIQRNGISTGVRQLDSVLYHRGWGRKELTLISGAAKSGKSMTLITFGANAVKLGYNVVMVSLEVSKDICSDRFDANFARIPMNHLEDQMAVAHQKIGALRDGGCGKLHIVDYPSGQLTPNDLRRFLRKQESRGHTYDLILLDYPDLMRPSFVTTNVIENSKSVFIDCRAIAYEMNAAVLAPTQLNREGFKAIVGRMEHMADDINKARTADLVISINATEDEKAKGIARYYFAASRNQQDGYTMTVKTARDQSNMITAVVSME